jgi:hypothetical protein
MINDGRDQSSITFVEKRRKARASQRTPTIINNKRPGRERNEQKKKIEVRERITKSRITHNRECAARKELRRVIWSGGALCRENQVTFVNH